MYSTEDNSNLNPCKGKRLLFFRPPRSIDAAYSLVELVGYSVGGFGLFACPYKNAGIYSRVKERC